MAASSRRWLEEHLNDEFVLRAKREGYRSRAVYKLLEIDDKDKLLRPGMTVVDLGAAPGGWSQVACRRLGKRGRVLALDILEMDSLAGVEFIQGDFREDEAINGLMEMLGDSAVDLVMSDMAPNMSGVRDMDKTRAMYLVELAFELARQILRPGGDLLMKVFQGPGYDQLIKELRHSFGKVVTRKPKASRDRSSEVYLLARGFRL
ncbi:MAG: 23S rRNA (uridine(2552)-2'-O)-methyltransferase RlmE [Gammaproteobacteria bacterium]|nr:23S rRNA (uridine(2552)-2'-O)-methyltransferase RlmE [Gammaproteobacteria bacterium]MCF6229602.1 23S rRNA (uridine(2552)-2'-O)-methyltransferase RlmE [Gammaproteobacteria bacterium]